MLRKTGSIYPEHPGRRHFRYAGTSKGEVNFITDLGRDDCMLGSQNPHIAPYGFSVFKGVAVRTAPMIDTFLSENAHLRAP